MKKLYVLLLATVLLMFIMGCSGENLDKQSSWPAGTYQVFESDASNLVDGVDNGYRQIYVRNLQTGETKLVSIGIDGKPAEGDCTTGTQRASISADGRYVVFDSDATNLVDMEFQGEHQVYLRDLKEGKTTLVSLGYDGLMGDYCAKQASISADGKYIVYGSNSSNIIKDTAEYELRQIFLYEIATKTTTLVSAGYEGGPGDDCSQTPVISADGRFVAFRSYATNLVEGLDTGGYYHIYHRDTQSNVTTLVSAGYEEGSSGNGYSYDPSISADGRYVAFYSGATNLVDGLTTNGTYQVYRRDMQSNVTILVSEGYDENPGNNDNYSPSISADGRYVAFYSGATNLVDGFTYNEYTQIYLRDIESENTVLISEGYDENPGNDYSYGAFMPVDGAPAVFFYSRATNLVAGDNNGYNQVYISHRDTGMSKVSVNSLGEEGNNHSYLKGN